MHVFLNTLRLHQHAVKACRGMPGPPEDRTPNPQALTSIVFAAASLEAFINELAEYMALLATEAAPEWATALNRILSEAEKSRASTQSKYLLTQFVFTGKILAKGESVYQDFDLLVQLRNDIVHPKPLIYTHDYKNGRWVAPEDAGIISRLRSTRALADVESIFGEVHDTGEQTWAAKIQTNFFDQISTKKLARWACNAAFAMVTETLKYIPDADMASRLQRVCALERIE